MARGQRDDSAAGRRRRLRARMLIGASVFVVAVAILARETSALRGLELRSVDSRFDIRGDRPAPRQIVVVEIDDATFNELGQRFPFPRGYHARVIDNLKRAGARTIAYDVQFTEPSGDDAQDNLLIEAVRRARGVVLATTVVDDNGKTGIFGGDDGLAVARAIPANGNFPDDPGSVIRRMRPRINGLTSFGVAAAQQYLGHRVHPPGGFDATPYIDFHGPPGTVTTIPFWRVYQGRFPPGLVKDKLVIVGASANSLQDLHPTSTTDRLPMPGPEIQAEATSTALDGFPLRTAPSWVNLAFIVLLGMAPAVLALNMRFALSVAAAAAVIALYAVGAQAAFQAGWIVQVVYPLGAGLLALAVTASLQGVNAALDRERVREIFSRFVPQAVVDDVVDVAGGARLGGVRRESTVMFSDLRGFTTFAEKLQPDEVIEVLNRYLSQMSDAILDNGGTLVAYMGDGIMAVFGAPIEQPDHAARALAAAREMLTRLDAFNEWLAARGMGYGFRMGIGLNSGQVLSGNVGSERRLEYTAIGDTTNTAARLEAMTKDTPHQLLIADSTRVLLGDDVQLVDAGRHEVRGREETLQVWALPNA